MQLYYFYNISKNVFSSAVPTNMLHSYIIYSPIDLIKLAQLIFADLELGLDCEIIKVFGFLSL
jgi:hypothetical protein